MDAPTRVRRSFYSVLGRALFFAGVLLIAGTVPAVAQEGGVAANCNDNIDNDGDGGADHLDTQCYELNCTDGLDNDADGHFDELAAGTPVGNEGPDPDCQCLDDVAGFTGGCTANDVSFVLVGLGTQFDGCVNAADSLDIQLGAQLTTTANERYDIGMWISADPSTSFTARTGRACRREILQPVAFSPTTPTPCDTAGDGPYPNADNGTGDLCGEIRTADNCAGSTDAFYQFSTRTLLPCSRASNGFINLDTCSSWDNQASDGSNNKPHCTNFTQAFPPNNAKCKCDSATATNVPAPNLNLSCGCTPQPNGTVNCTVTYTNVGLGTCTQAAGTGETEFACGTARYVEFETSYPTAAGDITTGPSLTGVTGTASDNATSGIVSWRPGSDPANTAGWIGVNETQTLSFTFTGNGSQTSGNLDFVTRAYWSNFSSFSPRTEQTTLTCSQATTPVTLAQFRAEKDGDEVVLEWATAAESGNAGFNVYARTASGVHQLNATLIPSRAIDSLGPQGYRFRAAAAGLDGAEFFVEDVALNGKLRRQGPFRLATPGGVRRLEAERIDWRAVRDEREAERSRGPRGLSAAAASTPARKLAVDLAVAADGLYRVTYEDLAQAGFDFRGVKPSELALYAGGAAVPLRATGGDKFGPGSAIEFHGRALDTLYTSTNVYRLRVERGALQSGVDAASPNPGLPAAGHYLETTAVERERFYGFGAANGDPWYDTAFQAFAPNGTAADFTLSVDHLVQAGGARLDVGLWGMTDFGKTPDHHALLRWNGALVAEEIFDGPTNRPISVALPDGAVVEGINTLRVTVPADLGVPYDFMALDRFAVTYPRAFVARGDRLSFTAAGARFEVSGFSSPAITVYRSSGPGQMTLLAGAQVSGQGGSYTVNFPGSAGAATYHVAASFLGAAVSASRDGSTILAKGSADYLVISHADFIDGLAPLLAARQSQGRTVRVADVRDVYAAFSDGVFDAAAIRAYVAWAAANLGTRDVLLVGGDTYDYRNFLGLGAVSFVPSPYVETSRFVRFAPADPAYADLNADGVPDLGIGRLPVRSRAQLDAVVANTLSYESKTYAGSAVFAADGYDSASAISFSAVSDRVANRLGSDWLVERAYMDTYGLTGAKGMLVGAINSGVALTNFFGHSGPTMWSFQGLFTAGDVAGLNNSGTPTVVAQWGCWNNYYVSPLYESLAQKLLLSGDRGAAAVLGATSLTEVSSDLALAERLAPYLAAPGMTVGQAVAQAKRDLALNRPELVDVLLGWTILGDPGLAVTP